MAKPHRLRVVVVGSPGSGKTTFLQNLLALNDSCAVQTITARPSPDWNYPLTIETKHLSSCEINVHFIRKNNGGDNDERWPRMRGIIQDELSHDLRYEKTVERWKYYVSKQHRRLTAAACNNDVPSSSSIMYECACKQQYWSGESDHVYREADNTRPTQSVSMKKDKGGGDDDDEENDKENGEENDGDRCDNTVATVATNDNETIILLRTLIGYELYDTSGGLWLHGDASRCANYIENADVIFAIYDSRNEESVMSVLRILGEHAATHKNVASRRLGRNNRVLMSSQNIPKSHTLMETLGAPPIRTRSLILVEMHHDVSTCATHKHEESFYENEVRSLRNYYKQIVELNARTTDWCSLSKLYNDARNCQGINRFFVRCYPCEWQISKKMQTHVFLQRVLGIALEPIVRNRYYLQFPALTRLKGNPINNDDNKKKSNGGGGSGTVHCGNMGSNDDNPKIQSMNLIMVENAINAIISAEDDEREAVKKDIHRGNNKSVSTIAAALSTITNWWGKLWSQ